jgi:hypothetical protein
MASCQAATGRPNLGVNLLQSKTVDFRDFATGESLSRLKELGADHVAIVIFLKQDSPADTTIHRGYHVTDSQLIAAIRTAHDYNLDVILKPQILVNNSWAGEVSPSDIEKWFLSYRGHIEHYAHISRRENVSAFVIGTELHLLGDREEWQHLIRAIRSIYPGKLTYAAHGIEGMQRFRHWRQLDAVGVTLYPPLGRTLNEKRISRKIENTLRRLKTDYQKPVWLLEIGHPSATESLHRPWDWHYLAHPSAEVDMAVQTTVLESWMRHIFAQAEAQNIERVTLWNWFNDPKAGGASDNDYTIQNKPAEQLIRCLWTDKC